MRSAVKASVARVKRDNVIDAKHHGTHQIVERKNYVKETDGPESN